jgi:LEA14-like dessication related protein
VFLKNEASTFTAGLLMRKIFVLSPVLAALALAVGCTAFAPKIDPPQLSIVNVGMVSADMFNQHFRVRMHVQNPNDRDVSVKGIDYKLFLAGDGFAEGMASRPFVIPAKGETEFDMTVQTNFVSSVGRLLSRLNGRDKVDYVFEGKVMTDFGKIPFQETGVVDFQAVR